MAVAGFKVQMVWQDGPLAITENYYWNGPGDDARTTVYPAALALMKARTLMMGAGIVAVRFRISMLNFFRAYVNSDPKDVSQMIVGQLAIKVSTSQQQQDAGIGNTWDGSSDQAPVAIQANFESTLQQHGRIFLAGVPDVLSRENPSGPWTVGAPGWLTLFNAWATILSTNGSKWSFKARTVPTDAPWKAVAVSALVFDATSGLWGVDVPTFTFPAGYNNTLQIRHFKMTSKAYVPVQGTFQINSVASSSIPGNSIYYLRGTQSWAGTQVLYLGTAQGVDYTLYPFRNITPYRETTHKRGNRQLAFPGRRRVVPRVSA